MYMYVAIAILVIAIVWMACSIKIVPQHHVGIVERLGKFHSLIKPGVNILVPLIDQVRNYQDTRIQKINLPSQVVTTKDHVQVQLDTMIVYQIVEPMQATYGMTDLVSGLGRLCSVMMQQIIGRLELNDNFPSSHHISAEMYKALKEAAAPLGIRIESIEVTRLMKVGATAYR